MISVGKFDRAGDVAPIVADGKGRVGDLVRVTARGGRRRITVAYLVTVAGQTRRVDVGDGDARATLAQAKDVAREMAG